MFQAPAPNLVGDKSVFRQQWACCLNTFMGESGLGACFCRSSYFFSPWFLWGEVVLLAFKAWQWHPPVFYFNFFAAFWLVFVYVALGLFLPVTRANIIAVGMNSVVIFNHFTPDFALLNEGEAMPGFAAASLCPDGHHCQPLPGAARGDTLGNLRVAKFRGFLMSIIFRCVQGHRLLPSLSIPWTHQSCWALKDSAWGGCSSHCICFFGAVLQ